MKALLSQLQKHNSDQVAECFLGNTLSLIYTDEGKAGGNWESRKGGQGLEWQSRCSLGLGLRSLQLWGLAGLWASVCVYVSEL